MECNPQLNNIKVLINLLISYIFNKFIKVLFRFYYITENCKNKYNAYLDCRYARKYKLQYGTY